MKYLVLFSIAIVLLSCKNSIDSKEIEAKEHGLFYLKGTNTLVNGKVITMSETGKLSSEQQYKNGQPLGTGYSFDNNGDTLSWSVGFDLRKYESALIDLNLNYSHVHITEGKNGDTGFATAYVDNDSFFKNPDYWKILARKIYADYSEKYNVADMMIWKKDHSVKISKQAAFSDTQAIDTIGNIIYVNDKKMIY